VSLRRLRRVGMAVCDAFIACWHQKYTYNLIRPVTYIKRLIGPGWLPASTTAQRSRTASPGEQIGRAVSALSLPSG
jgi:hypothetical protein